MNADGYDGLGLAYRYDGQLDKSIAAYRKMLSLSPDAGWDHTALGQVLLWKGDPQAALAEFEKEPIEVFRLSGLTQAYSALGRQAESDAAFAELMKKYPDTKPFVLAQVLASRGDTAIRHARYSRATADIDPGAVAVFRPRAAARTRALLAARRLGLAPEQLAAIKLTSTCRNTGAAFPELTHGTSPRRPTRVDASSGSFSRNVNPILNTDRPVSLRTNPMNRAPPDLLRW